MPIIRVPVDVENIAYKKDVSTSSSNFWGLCNLITDGDLSRTNLFVMDDMNPTWIQIDLGLEAEIHVVWIWHCDGMRERSYDDVIVQLSHDLFFSEDVITVFNNDADNSTGLGEGSDTRYLERYYGKAIVLKKPVTYRYVRLYSRLGSDSFSKSYREVEVYGKFEGKKRFHREAIPRDAYARPRADKPTHLNPSKQNHHPPKQTSSEAQPHRKGRKGQSKGSSKVESRKGQSRNLVIGKGVIAPR